MPHPLRLTLPLMALLIAGQATAHGSVGERLERLTREIAAHPNDAERYAARGQLNALDENWTQAAADFEEARELFDEAGEPAKVSSVELQLASAGLELGRAGAVIELLDTLCQRPEPPPDAYLLRGRAHILRGELALGVADLSTHLRLSTVPNPHTYRMRARAIAALGPTHLKAAVDSLEEGMRALGPLATLLDLAIELEAQRGDFDAALALVERLPPALRATPRWLSKRAQLLADAGRDPEAREAFSVALQAIDASPAPRRSAHDLTELRRELLIGQSELASPRAEEPPTHAAPTSTPVLWAMVGLMLLAAYLGARWQRSRPRPR